MKILTATAVLLIVTALLFMALFVCNFTVGSFFQSKDDSENGSWEAVGAALVFVLGLLPSFLWPVCAIVFVVFGILFLCKRKITNKTNGCLIALIILSIVFGAVLAFSLTFCMTVYLNYAKFFAVLGFALAASYVATFVCICISKSKVKKYLKAN